MGKSLVDMAKANPDKNYLGIEVHTPGVGACIAYAVEKGVKNLRVICHDATEILRDCVKDGELGGLQLFFPDPWHKTKHHKTPYCSTTLCRANRPKITTQWLYSYGYGLGELCGTNARGSFS